MKKRGISPIIATILLISIVLIIAIIIFLWFRGMSKEAITKFEGVNVEIICEEVHFDTEIDSFNNLIISNSGNVPIFNMRLEIHKEGNYETKDLKVDWPSDWPSEGVSSGIRAVIPLEPTISLTDVKELKLIPVLLGVSESGKKTHVCKGSTFEIIKL
jgi:flagellin-like protein